MINLCNWVLQNFHVTFLIKKLVENNCNHFNSQLLILQLQSFLFFFFFKERCVYRAIRVIHCVNRVFFRVSYPVAMQFGTLVQQLRRETAKQGGRRFLSFLDRRAQRANYLRLVSHVVRSFVARRRKRSGSREFRV